jgi:arylsulfatase A-like enzyme
MHLLLFCNSAVAWALRQAQKACLNCRSRRKEAHFSALPTRRAPKKSEPPYVGSYNQNRFLKQALRVGLIGLALAIGRAGAAEPAQPNILLIMTDDQGYGDFGWTGNPQLKTPNLDRLASQSVRFERFFVSPLCAPTRASLLTGRYSQRGGVWGVTRGKETMRDGEVTLAEVLREAGYQTGLFGKWHNGEHYPYTPPGQGFGEFLGFHNGHWNNYFDTPLLRGSDFVKTKGYITDVLTDEAIRFVERNKARPFFCYLPYNAPHSPYQVPDKYFDRFKAAGLSDELASVYGMCENLDDNIGRVLAKLDELKLAENTLVVFLTDNGPNGERFNAGMRGRKGSVHEGGVRVPLLVRWTGKLKPHTVTQIAAHIDLMPTLLDMCGVPSPKNVKLDGVSLRKLLEGRAENWPDRMLFTHNVRGIQLPEMFPGAARTQQYRLVNDGRGYELYDMLADPGQTKNIAPTQASLVKKFSAAYEAWWRDVSSAGFTRFPIPVGYAEENPVHLPAPQAYFDGSIRFFGGNGYANDWLTGWTAVTNSIYWELDVVNAGTYEVSLDYLCPVEDAGAKIRVTVGDASLETTVPGTPIKEIPLPHRHERESKNYVNRQWAELDLGPIKLTKGKTKLTVQALTKPGGQVMDLKEARLRSVE